MVACGAQHLSGGTTCDHRSPSMRSAAVNPDSRALGFMLQSVKQGMEYQLLDWNGASPWRWRRRLTSRLTQCKLHPREFLSNRE